ncbi:MAG: transglutaminase family protein [Gammaproteobacteria bacterium]|nr:transglutaminase family protein [Gammaproteobacteria bacterium]
MWLRTRCHLRFHMGDPTPLILMLRPRSGLQQWVARESYTLLPMVPVVEYTDIFGNLCQRMIAPSGDFSVVTSAEVMTADLVDKAPGASFVEIQHLPDAILSYLLPSRYCESDRFGDLAREIVDGVPLGYDQVHRISDWIRGSIKYTPGSSAFPLSAVEVNHQDNGVCRDLAHLGIALCRSISIPARMVVGFLYGLKPMDLHAWFEAFVGGRWYTFDPSDYGLRGGRLAVAYGRDAADVAIYHQFGPPALFSSMEVQVVLLNDPPE